MTVLTVTRRLLLRDACNKLPKVEQEKTLEDGVVLVETPSLAKLTGRINKVVDTLDHVPVCTKKQLGQV